MPLCRYEFVIHVLNSMVQKKRLVQDIEVMRQYKVQKNLTTPRIYPQNILHLHYLNKYAKFLLFMLFNN